MNKPAIEGGEPVRSNKIYYSHQYIDDADVEAVVRVLRGDYLTCGPQIEETERRLCEVTGARYAVLCSSGTSALHMACMAAGVGEGDEVITTPITFAASANCALYCGGRPVFADIDEKTWQLDPACVEEKITERTKAVVAVDFGGQSVDHDRFLALREKYGFVYIEDGAHVIGSSYKGRKSGSIADMTTLSFHPVKTICGGEGGAVLTDNEAFYQRLLLYRSHGITRDPSRMEHVPDGPWYYEQVALAPNYRITDMQAALIASQLDKLDRFAARKKMLRKKYDEAFSEIPQLIVQRETEGSDSVRHLYILRLNPEKLSIDRARFFEAMGEENIVCNVHYIPTYWFPYYEKLGYARGLCPRAERLYEHMITIPFYYAMTDEDADDVIRAVQKLCKYYAV
ncbi:UDP-4-amino-4,6-dideoxy-N-acetyl-beta-L-altrosamine transaminase [Lachnoclostridium sp. Marseille-P6806]|uniref:UDP-4-amino-4, 6-dideoxy-N-acetyl-beta-L-altrosamine transaminase n=1 Tax=Lachnoclostridium sp. Marseille-P6806 TaxID=2364793 RepID=UPI0010318CF5|nr:UDP-4-amino-4,6-dideoxy-N-acetyl-beta-L-altrosamine transaminase [Lachnoclostridium sp. Marseille-P6806]